MDICCKFRFGYGYGGSKPPLHSWNIDPKKNKMTGSNSGPDLQKKPDKVSAYEKKASCREQACLFLESMVEAGLDATSNKKTSNVRDGFYALLRKSRVQLRNPAYNS